MQAVELLDGEDAHAPVDGYTREVGRPTKKVRWWLAGGAALVVAVLGAGRGS